MVRPRFFKTAIIPMLAAVLTACTVGPDYVRPKVTVPVAYKEIEGWKQAEPRDHLPRGAWWEIFNDPKLNELEEQVNISNQNVAAAEAQYRQALATVKAAQAGYFPTLSLGSSASRSRGSENVGGSAGSGGSGGSGGLAGTGGTGGAGSSSGAPTSFFSLSSIISWEPDLWGKIRRTVESSQASAQASASDLENVRLLAHAQLAQMYFQLRALDSQKQVLDATAGAYQKFLQLTKNRYASGVAAKGDVLQAETQLKAAQALAIDVGVQRSQFEHAIAMLMGKAPSELTIAALPLDMLPPRIPGEVPSELLERRPDIASAERTAAAANAQIGVALAAYYPTISLGATGGFQASDVAKWLVWPSHFWTLGPATLQQTIFDGGLRSAQTEQARANYEAKAASYRQTVLTGFQQVEDNLAAFRILEQEAEVQAEALKAARQSLDVTINRYKSGIASALDVIVTQTIALNNELSAVNILGRRMSSCVLLVEALGGGWSASDSPPAGNEGGKKR